MKEIYRYIYYINIFIFIEFLSSSVHIDGEASLVSIDQLNIIADMLGLNQNELTRCLTSRSFGVRSIVTCIYTVQQVYLFIYFLFIFFLFIFITFNQFINILISFVGIRC